MSKCVMDRRRFLAALAAASASSALPTFVESSAAQEKAADAAQSVAPQIEYGADYYAEDWPPERVELDARLMQEAKFRTVRLADTNWERLEPAEGHYDFGWLERVLEVLSRYGIRAVLCTSSYVLPAWLGQKHPEFFLMDESGRRRRWGGMGFMCLNHPLYRQYVEKLVTRLASHFGQHPAVIGWQIDNEMGIWGAECFDPDYCVPKFRRYLKEKFQTVEELNRRLLTVSYGHRYSSWEQVQLRSSVAEDALQVPLLLEARRFFSRNIAEFLAFQAALLRRLTKNQFITHNGIDRSQNCFEATKALDFLSADVYPMVGQFTDPALTCDLTRAANHGKSFLVLEQRSGTYGDYTLKDATPPPGLARLWAWQSVAHGADGVLFFRWRRNNGGSEQYWQGLLNNDGTPSRVFPEIAQLGNEFANIGHQIAQAESPANIALVVSYDSLWALQIGNPNFPYFSQLKEFSSSFRRCGINIDFVEAASDLGKYKIVVAPALHVVDPEAVSSLQKFVSNGGILILTARSGFKNPDNLATQVPPGPLHGLAKVWVRDFVQLSPPERTGLEGDPAAYQPSPENAIQSASTDWTGEYCASGWLDILEADGAQTLFRFQRDYYADKPAVTLADHGKGRVIYIGATLESRFYTDLARHVCSWSQIELGPEIPPGMDFALRQRDGHSFLFLLNFAADPQTVKISGEHRDLLSGKILSGQVTVAGLDLRVLVQKV
ncbi:MAG TPA: beta-galactosidase [Candidatus Sulfotelmatobacter sp.]|nr:beta-galactosidase [Candidatus Sulfotelmatobacter sp.]